MVEPIPEQESITVEDAVSVLAKEYWRAVRDIASEAAAELRAGEIVDDEGLDDWIFESVDGSEWVIYTYRNIRVLMNTDHPDAFFDDCGESVQGQDLGSVVSALAFHAMRADVRMVVEEMRHA